MRATKDAKHSAYLALTAWQLRKAFNNYANAGSYVQQTSNVAMKSM